MGEKNKEAILADIASHSLKGIESVGNAAKSALKEREHGGTSAPANINTFNNPQAVREMRRVAGVITQELNVLAGKPLIARVHLKDENNEEYTLFIAPNGAGRAIPDLMVASYRKSEFGKLASQKPGYECTLRIKGKERDLLIESIAHLHPECENGTWDSRDTKVGIAGFKVSTITSLLAILEISESELASLWDDEEDESIIEGRRRAILTHMGLRDQPILDMYQDEIFRMPINTRYFLSGPPGTGKTTTLIRRLGQKADWEALEPSEHRLANRVMEETGRPHEESWILFSPTELLRQYVKEAFAREGHVASDNHIRTWKEFRHELARDRFGLLRTSTGSGSFVERSARDFLEPDASDNGDAWYDDFREYLDEAHVAELTADSEWLAKRQAAELRSLGERLLQIMQSRGRDFYASTIQKVDELVPEIQEAISERNKEINRILNAALNRLGHADSKFPEQLREQISRQLASESQEAEEEEDADAEIEDDEEQVVEPQAGRPVSNKQAISWFKQAIRSLAGAKAASRRISDNTRSGILLSWLGEERWPPKEDIEALGKLLMERVRLGKFRQLERQFLRGVARKYKNFRSERAKEKRWYQAVPEKPSDIHWSEIDLLILVILRIANEIIDSYRRKPGSDMPTAGIPGAVRDLQKAQILVDEATDFSCVQLASMYELAHPLIRSFFMCGDINQRLTSWGIKADKELNWFKPAIERKTITVSYRQTRLLVNLAKAVAKIGDSYSDVVLPEELDVEGVAPAWQDGLDDDSKIADWLAQRIMEIERMVQKPTTIAVLVNAENQVKPLAEKLKSYLEEINLSAVACEGGKVVGNDRDVRVFDIQHIKGMEFEAVFFVDLDKTIELYPDLFTKYLYVGATRAATYLGITFHGDIPPLVQELKSHFSSAFP